MMFYAESSQHKKQVNALSPKQAAENFIRMVLGTNTAALIGKVIFVSTEPPSANSGERQGTYWFTEHLLEGLDLEAGTQRFAIAS